MIISTIDFDQSSENRTIGSLICYDSIVKNLHKHLDPKLFFLEQNRNLVIWIKEYFDKYNSAPRNQIYDVIQSKKTNYTKEFVDTVDEHTRINLDIFLHEENPNINYLEDLAGQYLRKRNIEVGMDQVKDLLEKKRLEDAERILNDINKNKVNPIKFEWHSPFEDISFINKSFEEQGESLIKFGNCYDDLFGKICRGYLIGIQGAFKRGKTWFLQELMFHAITTGKRVAFIQMEMKDYRWIERFYRQLTKTSDKMKLIDYPFFDCIDNDGSCEVKKNLKDIHKRKVPQCFYCLGKEDKRQYFRPMIKKEKVKPRTYDSSDTKETIQLFNETFGDKLFRTLSFPMYSATFSDIQRSIDYLRESQNFIPDFIIIDYADVIKKEHPGMKDLEHEHYVWMQLKAMADRMDCVVVTPTQMNREGTKRESARGTDIGGFVRKRGTVDIMATINQTDHEKSFGAIRIGIIDHRWKDFHLDRQALVLTQLGIGQPFLDGMIVKVEKGGVYKIE